MGFCIVESLFAVSVPDGCIEVSDGLVEGSLCKVSFATVKVGQKVMLNVVMAALFVLVDEARKGLDCFRVETVQLFKIGLQEKASKLNEVSGD